MSIICDKCGYYIRWWWFPVYLSVSLANLVSEAAALAHAKAACASNVDQEHFKDLEKSSDQKTREKYG